MAHAKNHEWSLDKGVTYEHRQSSEGLHISTAHHQFPVYKWQKIALDFSACILIKKQIEGSEKRRLSIFRSTETISID